MNWKNCLFKIPNLEDAHSEHSNSCESENLLVNKWAQVNDYATFCLMYIDDKLDFEHIHICFQFLWTIVEMITEIISFCDLNIYCLILLALSIMSEIAFVYYSYYISIINIRYNELPL